MISQTLQITMLLSLLVYFILLVSLLKKKRLSLKYTLLWLLSGVIMLLLTIFPEILSWISELVGIYDITNALFAILAFCGIIILVSLTAIVSKLSISIVRLTQTVSMLEYELRQLRQKNVLFDRKDESMKEES